MWNFASEGKGSWVPEGWALPGLFICLAFVLVSTLIIRHRKKK